jgi:aminoglycoside 3-N-acetyltransferase
MWTQRQLAEDLKEIGLPSGSLVLAHVALETIGPIDGGPETLVAAFRETLGPAGTLLVPTFGPDPEERPVQQSLSGGEMPYDDTHDGTPPRCSAFALSSSYGIDGFADTVSRQFGAFRSSHTTFSFTALGAEAEALTSHVPFHYPLGSEGPLARLHARNGWILLIGLGHSANLSLHLAEIWANVPYVHRSVPMLTGSGEETAMLGNPECSAGFVKIEPLLRQSRILRRGYIGNAESQLMRQQQTVSMAVAMLQGSPAALLCDDETCRSCLLARRLTAEQTNGRI